MKGRLPSNVEMTSMRRDDVASTSVRSLFDVLCLLGIYYSDHLLQDSVKLLLTQFFSFFHDNRGPRQGQKTNEDKIATVI